MHTHDHIIGSRVRLPVLNRPRLRCQRYKRARAHTHTQTSCLFHSLVCESTTYREQHPMHSSVSAPRWICQKGNTYKGNPHGRVRLCPCPSLCLCVLALKFCCRSLFLCEYFCVRTPARQHLLLPLIFDSRFDPSMQRWLPISHPILHSHR